MDTAMGDSLGLQAEQLSVKDFILLEDEDLDDKLDGDLIGEYSEKGLEAKKNEENKNCSHSRLKPVTATAELNSHSFPALGENDENDGQKQNDIQPFHVSDTWQKASKITKRSHPVQRKKVEGPVTTEFPKKTPKGNAVTKSTNGTLENKNINDTLEKKSINGILGKNTNGTLEKKNANSTLVKKSNGSLEKKVSSILEKKNTTVTLERKNTEGTPEQNGRTSNTGTENSFKVPCNPTPAKRIRISSTGAEYQTPAADRVLNRSQHPKSGRSATAPDYSLFAQKSRNKVARKWDVRTLRYDMPPENLSESCYQQRKRIVEEVFSPDNAAVAPLSRLEEQLRDRVVKQHLLDAMFQRHCRARDNLLGWHKQELDMFDPVGLDPCSKAAMVKQIKANHSRELMDLLQAQTDEMAALNYKFQSHTYY